MSTVVPFSSVFHQNQSTLEVTARVSLPAVISNMMVLVDYVASNTAVPTPWPWDVWSGFSTEESAARARMSPVLVHGLMLQKHWLETFASPGDEPETWQDVRASVEQLDDQQIRRLLARGWVSGVQHYLQEMPRTEEMDALLPANVESITVQQLEDQPHLLNELHAFTYANWGIPKADLPAYVAFAWDAAQVRSAMLQVLDAIWRNGGEARWQSGRDRLERWAESATDRLSREHFADPLTAIRELTGRTPPDRLQPEIQVASRVVILPSLELGSSQSIVSVGDTVYLMFEPDETLVRSGNTATDQMKLADAVALLRAMSDPAAFSLVQTLQDREELYALAIAEDAGIHQSTVSRHLSVLEQHGVVRVRRDGKAKYYQLQRDRVQTALAVVAGAVRPE